jgi:hypothetical protein
MKLNQWKGWAGVLCLAAAAHAEVASAHNQNGALGRRPKASDVYLVTCADDGNGPPSHILFQVQDFGPANSARLQVSMKKGRARTKVKDLTPGNGAYTPWQALAQGPGTYTMRVGKKPGRGNKVYDVAFHCWSNQTNQHTGTTWFPIRDQ